MPAAVLKIVLIPRNERQPAQILTLIKWLLKCSMFEFHYYYTVDNALRGIKK